MSRNVRLLLTYCPRLCLWWSFILARCCVRTWVTKCLVRALLNVHAVSRSPTLDIEPLLLDLSLQLPPIFGMLIFQNLLYLGFPFSYLLYLAVPLKIIPFVFHCCVPEWHLLYIFGASYIWCRRWRTLL